jgi:hypothetical protein
MQEPIWSGKVRSLSGRTSRRDGQVLEYRVAIYPDGTGVCTCQGYMTVPREERPTYRCKHLRAQIARLVREGQVIAPPPLPSGGNRAPVAGPPPVEAPVVRAPDDDDFLSDFMTDDLDELPRSRHE